MKGTKQYRFENNPLEKEFHDEFIKRFGEEGRCKETLCAIIFGWNASQTQPEKFLTEEEETICVNLIQWLGSPVGQGFIRDVHEKHKANDGS